mgnify:CR=1 FL=1
MLTKEELKSAFVTMFADVLMNEELNHIKVDLEEYVIYQGKRYSFSPLPRNIKGYQKACLIGLHAINEGYCIPSDLHVDICSLFGVNINLFHSISNERLDTANCKYETIVALKECLKNRDESVIDILEELFDIYYLD